MMINLLNLKLLKYFSGLFIIFFSSSLVGLELIGNYIQGGLVRGKIDMSIVSLELNNLPVAISEEGFFILGFHRNNNKQNILKIFYQDSSTEIKVLNIERRKYKIQKINGLKKNKVEPRKEDIIRIKKEKADVVKARKINIKKPYYLSGFLMPAEGIITGVYGSQRILNGIKRNPHFGLDIANKNDSPIVSSSDGVVIYIGYDRFFSGNTIIIGHGQKLTTSYLHLNNILVSEGQEVKKGDMIGSMGMTGRATGVHLHWGLEWNGVRLDPELVLKNKF